MNGQHSSARASWGTPSAIVEFARKVLGCIDVDPFTSEAWNQTVRARYIHTEATDGFESPWVPGWPKPSEFAIAGHRRTALTALVNPPVDPRGANVRRAWDIAEQSYSHGHLSGGVIWVCFNLNQFRTLQTGTSRSPLNAAFVRLIPRKRIPYDESPGVSSKSPSHDSAIVLMPSCNEQRTRFAELGHELGEVF